MVTNRIEFFVKPDGNIVVDIDGHCHTYEEKDRELSLFMLDRIHKQYPAAYAALEREYGKSKANQRHYEYLRVHRFIRCNFGKSDGLTFDVDNGVLHIEDVPCPIKCECPLFGIVCKPKPLGLSVKFYAKC